MIKQYKIGDKVIINEIHGRAPLNRVEFEKYFGSKAIFTVSSAQPMPIDDVPGAQAIDLAEINEMLLNIQLEPA
jgi:hypothetical protein